MADYITTILSTITDHPQAVAAVASVYGIAKPFLAKILGPAADEVGEIGRDYIKGFRAANTAKTLAEASKMLSQAAIEPQPVAPKVLLPLLDGASLEDDDFLRQCWASLLANAANPQSRIDVTPSFVEIMKQITPVQVRVLSALFPVSRGGVRKNDGQFTMDTSYIREQVGNDVSAEEFDIAFDNLVRLRLCTASGLFSLQKAMLNTVTNMAGLAPGGVPQATTELALATGAGTANIGSTALGIAFLKACLPPEVAEASK